MTTAAINKEIMKYLSSFGKFKQEKVLDFLRSPVDEKQPSSSNLLPFAGSIKPDDLKQIEQAINEGCEHIDEHGW